jgi:hypothetical protein
MFLNAQMFLYIFSTLMFLYIFLHSYLVCANNLTQMFETVRLRFIIVVMIMYYVT